MIPVALLEWRHPRHGYVRETVCSTHERDVMSALRTLGIGCGGRRPDPETHCWRCSLTGEARWSLAERSTGDRSTILDRPGEEVEREDDSTR